MQADEDRARHEHYDALDTNWAVLADPDPDESARIRALLDGREQGTWPSAPADAGTKSPVFYCDQSCPLARAKVVGIGPEGAGRRYYHIPVLTYPDVRQAVAWLSAAFGFVERVRIGENHRAQLRFGDVP